MLTARPTGLNDCKTLELRCQKLEEALKEACLQHDEAIRELARHRQISLDILREVRNEHDESFRLLAAQDNELDSWWNATIS
ncbi:hypothetical protein DXG01_005370 [Tephrocybe rancida]|nr:hypothetical protein DXG01_005370 [Tephrocybe rancida]